MKYLSGGKCLPLILSKKNVYAEGRQFTSEDELKQAILVAWAAIPPQTIRNLVTSMHNRMMDVLEKHGKHI